MALADFSDYKLLYKRPQMHAWWQQATNYGNTDGIFGSPWSTSGAVYPAPVGGTAPGIPSTAAALSSASGGAWIRPVAGSGDQIVVSALLQPRSFGHCGMLIDRLSHQGGLSGTVTTTQTTNLPTAALTRYTSGVGVYAALEFYAAVGATNAVWTVVYTNQAGTGSRSVSFQIDYSPSILTFVPIPLQGSDTGVRSVQSVTLTPSTGTAGNFGVVLFKPLMTVAALTPAGGKMNDIFDLPGWNTPIDDAACLEFLIRQGVDNPPTDLTIGFGES